MKKKYGLVLLTLLWAGLIFSFSLQPADVSSETSMGFARKVIGWFLPNFLQYMDRMSKEQFDLFHYIVRKGAHFTEYFVLGIWSGLSAMQFSMRRKKAAALGFCVLTASIDETIQLFVSGRAGRIQDVMLDGTGAAAGILLLWGLCRICKKGRRSSADFY